MIGPGVTLKSSPSHCGQLVLGPHLGLGPSPWTCTLHKCAGSLPEKGPVLGSMLCCHYLYRLSNFLTRGSIFLFCPGAHNFHGWSWLGLLAVAPTPGLSMWPGLPHTWQLGSRFESFKTEGHSLADYSSRETFKVPCRGSQPDPTRSQPRSIRWQGVPSSGFLGPH